jgi:aldose 1-epimerase
MSCFSRRAMAGTIAAARISTRTDRLSHCAATCGEYTFATVREAAITSTPFGRLPTGESVELYTLSNATGMKATISTYGGAVTYLSAPDRSGRYDNVVLGFDSLADYLGCRSYVGALIGRFSNRIACGRFKLEGVPYALAINDAPNSSHGGAVGFDKVIWKVADATITPGGPRLTLSRSSPDGEEGYPGNLSVTAVYTLSEVGALRLELHAVTDKSTVINLSHHAYFNLRGADNGGDVLSHVVQINADRFTPVDSAMIPTGELRPVAETPFDFRTPVVIGARIADPDEQLRIGNGYDHNWVLDKAPATLRLDARIYEPESGRILEVSSDQPGLQLYTGNFLGRSEGGNGGREFAFRSGFCMEPQHFPDSPNHPNFPSTVLIPGQSYRSTIVYQFATSYDTFT